MTWKLTKEISNLKSGTHHCKYEDGFTVHLRYDQTVNKWFRDSDNIEEIKKAIEDLSKASHGFATRMYQEAAQAQQTQQGEATAESNETKDDVQDAEVVD